MRKLIVPLFLMCLTIGTATSCGPNKSTIDSDYDGLTDDIDPDPNNNLYRFDLEQESEDMDGQKTISKTKEDILTIDYRDFFKDTSAYNLNLAKLSSVFISEHKPNTPKILNNIYPKEPTKESTISPIFAQMGGKDIEKVSLWEKYKNEKDRFDVANMYLAHHTINIDNKKHQVFLVNLEPYVNSTGWFSNFDAGTDNDNYKNITGEHPEWSDKKIHKGFDVTAVRVKKELDDYRNKHIEKDANVITYITGHSRGGSVAMLTSKKMIDEGQKVVAYCINPANVTTETDQSVLNKYKEIHSLVNRDDYVSLIPLKEWNNFTKYGQVHYYQLSNHLADFKNYFGYDYMFNTQDALQTISNFLVSKASSRNNMYEFSSIEHNDGYTYDSEEEAKEAIDEMKGKFDYCACKEQALKCVDFYTKKVDTKYKACWKIMPCIFAYATLEATLGFVNGESLVEILINLNGYIALLMDFVQEAIGVLNPLIKSGKFSVAGFACAHQEPSCLVGVNFIE